MQQVVQVSSIIFVSLLGQQIPNYLVFFYTICNNLDNILFPVLLNNIIHHLKKFVHCLKSVDFKRQIALRLRTKMFSPLPLIGPSTGHYGASCFPLNVSRLLQMLSISTCCFKYFILTSE